MSVRFSSFTHAHPSLPMSARKGPDLAAAGYLEAEYAVTGHTVRYDIAERTFDGQWSATPGDEAEFVTRIVVRRPAGPADFSGTVLCEWLNVSSGQEAAPDWTYLADEIVRQGHVWVGVSAQWTGVHGGVGAVATAAMTGAKGLLQLVPERYEGLHHPGDAWSFGIFAAVAEALRDVGPDHDAGPLSGLVVQRVLAIGESQAAYALTTFINAVAPLRPVFDGFLVHSRGVAGLTSDDVDGPARIEQVVTSPPCQLRQIPGSPILIVEAEGDLTGRINYLPARQDDGPWLRVWEIAGAAHADFFTIGEFESFLDCPTPVNRGQMAYVLRAALRALVEWSAEGVPAPSAPAIETDASGFVCDEIGNVVGGVRTPVVDVPTTRLVGVGLPDSSLVCQLFGQTLPVDAALLTARYRDAADYLTQYADAVDRLVAAGFLLDEDRDELMAEADPATVEKALNGEG